MQHWFFDFSFEKCNIAVVLRGHRRGRKRKFSQQNYTKNFHPEGEEDSERKFQALQLKREFSEQYNTAAWLCEQWREEKRKFATKTAQTNFHPEGEED